MQRPNPQPDSAYCGLPVDVCEMQTNFQWRMSRRMELQQAGIQPYRAQPDYWQRLTRVLL